MSTARVIDFVVLVVLLAVAVRVVPAAWNILRVYLGIKTRRLEDATSFSPAPPPAVTAVLARLVTIGFRRIGERSLVLPGDQRRFEWNLVDEPTTTYIAVVPARTMPGSALVAFYSAYADGAFVVTTFPTTERVQRPDFDAAPGAATIEDTATLHRQRAAAFSRVHGPALQNRSMADLLQRDDTYRRRHGGATMKVRVYRFVALSAVLVLVAALELVRVVVIDG